jgi:hypothetical protein
MNNIHCSLLFIIFITFVTLYSCLVYFSKPADVYYIFSTEKKFSQYFVVSLEINGSLHKSQSFLHLIMNFFFWEEEMFGRKWGFVHKLHPDSYNPFPPYSFSLTHTRTHTHFDTACVHIAPILKISSNFDQCPYKFWQGKKEKKTLDNIYVTVLFYCFKHLNKS